MLGHRKLTATDYLDILKRRRLLLLSGAVLVPILAVGATFFIPATYLSQTLVLIEEQKVPDDFVKPVISSNLDNRLASMKEQILSRSRIQPIIERYKLYAGQRMTMDDRIAEARKSIGVKTIPAATRTGGLPGFFISFTANDAHTAQLVCGEITSLFLNENQHSRTVAAEGTTDFLEGQLADAKRSLDEQDAKLAEFQRQYVGKLPGESAPNLNMLTSLNTQLEAATQSLARMEQDKTYEESMLAQQVQASQPVTTTTGGTVDPAQAALYQSEQSEMSKLVAEETDLTTHYTADYPDVIAVRRKIADLRRRMMAPPVATPGTTVARSAPDSLPVQQLRAQIRAADIGIQDKRREQAQISGNIHLYQDRIQSSPLVAEQYKVLTRDYDTAQKFYDALLAKKNQSKMATDLERRQQGEQFRVMDEPNLPDAPSFPKKWMFAVGGLFGGLFLGLGLAAFLEYRDTSLRSDRDVFAFTRLPTLGVIAVIEGIPDGTEKKGLLARFRRKPKDKADKKLKKGQIPTTADSHV